MVSTSPPVQRPEQSFPTQDLKSRHTSVYTTTQDVSQAYTVAPETVLGGLKTPFLRQSMQISASMPLIASLENSASKAEQKYKGSFINRLDFNNMQLQVPITDRKPHESNDYIEPRHHQQKQKRQQIQTERETSTTRQSMQVRAKNKLWLKPAQIIEEAKKDVQFGSRHNIKDARQGANSFAILQSYLNKIQPHNAFDSGSDGNNTDQDTIRATIADKFKIKDVIRQKDHTIQQISTSQDEFETGNLLMQGSQSQAQMQVMDHLSPQGDKKNTYSHFQSMSSLGKAMEGAKTSFKEINEGGLDYPSGHVTKMHNTVKSSTSTFNSNQMLHVRPGPTIRITNQDKAQRFKPKLSKIAQQTADKSQSLLDELAKQQATQKRVPQASLKQYSSQSRSNSPSQMVVSQSHKLLSIDRMNVPNGSIGAKEKQKRIVSKFKMLGTVRNQGEGKVFDHMQTITNPQNHPKMTTKTMKMTPKNAGLTHQLLSPTKLNRDRGLKTSLPLNDHNVNYFKSSSVLIEILEPAEPVKVLPLKTRKIFKRAMKELDRMDLVNSKEIPLSRPRIRAILQKMKANLEQTSLDEKQTYKDIETDHNDTSDPSHNLLRTIGEKAEFELFGMLIKEKEQRQLNQARNKDLQKLYEVRMNRKRLEYDKLKARQERRATQLKGHEYVSDQSSLSEDHEDEGGNSFEMIEPHALGLLQSAKQRKDDQPTSSLLSSERPSSSNNESEHDALAKTRKASERRQQKQKKIILEELLHLLERPSKHTNPQAGNFYNQFQNIDKIIEQENNEQMLSQNYDEDMRRQKLQQDQKKIESLLRVPVLKKHFEPAYQQQSEQSGLITPYQHQEVDETGEANKSPIIEYLKQVQKDKLFPHFLPFKHLQDATISGGVGFKYSLDSFSVNARVAPSIASAIRNIAGMRVMSLIDTMLHEDAFMTIFAATPATLTSLNLSQNEHLTHKCYQELHKFTSLTHLTLERCNIGDDTLAILLDPDPLKLSPDIEQDMKKSPVKNRKATIQKSFSAIKEVDDDEEEEGEIQLSGLIKTLSLFNASINRITDHGASLVADFVSKSERLQTLQLHWNKIRAKGAIALARALKLNKTVQILDLSFNSFGGVGGGASRRACVIADEKKEEDVAAVLRHMTGDKGFECADSAWKWRKTFMRNLTLLHVDISFNGFSGEDMIAIGDGLRENHSLLGLHIKGNGAKLDGLGFVCPTPSTKKVSKQTQQRGKEVQDVHKYDRIPVTMENEHLKAQVKPQKRRKLNSVLAATPTLGQDGAGLPSLTTEVPRNCWLCEHWREDKFEIRLPDKFIGCVVQSVYIHLSFEDYKPLVMNERIEEVQVNDDAEQKKQNTPNEQKAWFEMAQVFQLYRMVPPSPHGIKYFFSLQNPKNFKKETFIDPRKKRIFVEEEIKNPLSMTMSSWHNDMNSQNGSEPRLPFPKFINLTKAIKPTQQIVERSKLHALPRSAFNTQELERPKSPWNVQKSQWAGYKFDTEELLAQCFDFDWGCSTLDRAIKDPHQKEELIRYLKPRYGMFREAYKNLSCLAPAGNVPSIGTNILSDLMLRCGEFVDYRLTKLSDVDLAFIASNAAASKQFPFSADLVLNPERQLIRYQFLEVIVKLGLERFQQKQKMSPADGIKVFYEQFIYDTMIKYESHPWRLERYWNEECEIVIKENSDVLHDFYNHWAQSQSPGEPKVLRFNRLIDLVTCSGVCDDNFGAREIGPLFNQAMQTKVDEIHSTKHMDMLYLEFIECLARIADKAIYNNFADFPAENDKNNLSSQQQSQQKQRRQKLNSIATSGDGESKKATSVFQDRSAIKNSKKLQQPELKIIRETTSAQRRKDPNLLLADTNRNAILMKDSSVQSLGTVAASFTKQDLRDQIIMTKSDVTLIDKSNETLEIFGGATVSDFSIENHTKSGIKMYPIKTPMKKKRQQYRSTRSKSGEPSSERSLSIDSKSQVSKYDGEQHLSEKIRKYINRIAVTCMGPMYSTRYLREYRRKAMINSKRLHDLHVDAAAAATLLGQSGYRATLQKLRYSDQKPPVQPSKSPRGNRKSQRK